MPYDENVLHKLGYARYLSGDAAAQRLLSKTIRIDPHDTVAKYYLNQCKHAEGGQKKRFRALDHTLPGSLGEAFRRLNHITEGLSAARGAL
jgi:hypothetical protein